MARSHAWLGLGLLVIGAASLASRDPALMFGCLVTLPCLILLLWSKGEPPILLASCAIQWLQVVTSVFYTEATGLTLEEVFETPEMRRAVWLSLIGILVLALGIRVAWRRSPPARVARLGAEAQRVALDRAFLIWLAAFGVASSASLGSGLVPGLDQALYALVGLKWVFCFTLAFGVLTRNRGYGFLLITILIEFVTGSLGYFAGFKEVFYMVFLAAACTPTRLPARARALIAAAFVVVLGSSVVWTAIKKEYRTFQVSDSPESKSEKLLSLLRDLDEDDLAGAVELLVLRVEYLQYFAYTLHHVPDVVPYENGALWKGAVLHVFMPRAFFPEKASIDDSERTMTYTGVWVAGADQGTSIGIGYMAESYVDFGPWGMFVPIFLLGLFFGGVYRLFATRSESVTMGYAIAVAALFSTLGVFGTSNVKIVGGILTASIVLYGFDRFVSARAMAWLCRAPASRRRTAAA